MIQRLPKGYAVVIHDRFTSPVLVRFPRPPCAQKRPIEYEILSYIASKVPKERVNEVIEKIRRALKEKPYEELKEILSEWVNQGFLPEKLIQEYLERRKRYKEV